MTEIVQEQDRGYASLTTSPDLGPTRDAYLEPLTPVQLRLSVQRDVAQEKSACSGSTMSQVRFLSSRRVSGDAIVPWNGTRFCEDRRQRFDSSRWHQRAARAALPTSNRSHAAHLFRPLYVAVWDGSGVQSRGAVFDSLAACRSSSGCSSAWQSARFGTERSKVQVLLPRRQRFACSLSSERAAVRRDSRWRHLWPFGTAPLL
jgi:hypothetical protein